MDNDFERMVRDRDLIMRTATMNLNLTSGENPENVTVLHDKAKELGIPFEWAKSMDNSQLRKPLDAAPLHPLFQRYLAGHFHQVPMFRDQLPEMDRLVRRIAEADLTPEARARELQKLYEEKGVPYPARLSLARRGYQELAPGVYLKDGEVVRNPVSLADTLGKEERKLIARAMDRLKEAPGFQAAEILEFDRLSEKGKKVLLGRIAALMEKENAILRQMNYSYPEGWNHLPDRALRKRLEYSIAKRRGIDISDVSLARLRKGDVDETDFLEMFNVLGIRDIYRYATALSPEELAAIGENSSVGDQLKKIDYLARQSLDLRGRTTAGQIATVVVNMIPYMIEFAATGGAATVAKGSGRVALGLAIREQLAAGGFKGFVAGTKALATREGWKALGKAGGMILKGEARRLPAYAPKITFQSLNEWRGGPVYYLSDGVKVALPERTADELATLILRNTLQTYMGNVSEWGGEFLPGVDLSKFIPKQWRNRIVQQFVNDISKDNAKRAIFGKAVAGNLPLQGWAPEMAEEWINNAMERGSTVAARITGWKALDMGRESVFGDKEENIVIAVSSLIGSTGGKMLRLPGAVQHYRRLTRFVDTHRGMVDAIAATKLIRRSPGQAREFLEVVRGGDTMLQVDPEDAAKFREANPDFAQSIGITAEGIAEAQSKGLLLQVSQNQLLVEQAKSPEGKAAGEQFLVNVQHAGVTVKEALAADMGKDAVSAFTEQRERIERFSTKIYTACETAALSTGASPQAVRSFARVAAFMVNHLYAHSTVDGEVESALDALTVEFIKNPESFAPKPLTGAERLAIDKAIPDEKPEVPATGAAAEKTEVPAETNEKTEVPAETNEKTEVPAETNEKTEVPATEAPSEAPVEKSEVQAAPKERSEAPVETNAPQPVEQQPAAAGEREKQPETPAVPKEKELPAETNKYAPLEKLSNATVKEWQPTITKMAARLAQQYSSLPVDEGEAVSIAYLALARAQESYREGGDATFRTYAISAIKNAFRDYTKKLSTQAEESLNEEVGADGATRQDFIADDTAVGPDERAREQEASAILSDWKNTLTPRQKRILALLKKGKSQVEIARELGVTKEAVNQAVKRLREQAKSLLMQRDRLYQTEGASYMGVPFIYRPESVKLSEEEQREVDRQIAEVRKQYEGTPQWLKAPNGEPSLLVQTARDLGLPEEDLWLKVRTPFFKAWFGDWENKARRTAGHVTEDSAPVTPALSPASRVSHPYGKYTSDIEKSQVGLLDENGEPLVVFHGTPSRFGKFNEGDIGFHFGTKEQAANRVRNENGPIDNAGIYFGFLNLRKPLYAGLDFGSWESSTVAVKIFNRVETGALELALTKSDVALLSRLASGGSTKGTNAALRNWLVSKGYDGVIYDNTAYFEGEGNSYIIFDAHQFKSAENLGTFSPTDRRFYHQSGKQVVRGATSFAADFNTSFQATVSLFKDADASTLPHEAAHWLKRMMETLVESGHADEQLTHELETINKWLDRQKYKSKKGSVAYEIEREEKFARAFEAYIQTGRPPVSGVEAAFNTLKHYLMAIYKFVRALPESYGFTLDREIVSVFESMLSTAELVEKESPLIEAADALKETYQGLLGLSQDEARDFIRLIRDADTQMADTIERRKKRLLPPLRKQWTEQAEEIMKSMRVYQTWASVVEAGGLDYKSLVAMVGRETAEALRAMGLTGKVHSPGADVPLLAEKAGYASPDLMIAELLNTSSPKDFIAQYLAEQESKFNADLGMDESAMSARATMETLDKLAGLLAVKGGIEGYRLRREELKLAARREIAAMPVKDVINDRRHIDAVKALNRKLVHAISKKDFATAFDLAEKIRRNLFVLSEKADAKKTVEKVRRILRRAGEAKRGSIYGDHHEALKELAYYFGFSKRQPDELPGDETYRKRAAAPRIDAELFGDPPEWPDFLFRKEIGGFQELDFASFESLADFASFLYGEGRELVKEAKGTFAARVANRIEACTAVLDEQQAKYDNRKDKSFGELTRSRIRSFLHWGKNLNTLLGRADRFSHMGGSGVRGPNMQLRDMLAEAESRMIALAESAKVPCAQALKTLEESAKGMKMPLVEFTGDGLLHGYSRWTPQMVTAACLNMGNELNRQRLMEGYGWQEEDLAKIASCLTSKEWECIQQIWDTLSGDLQKEVSRTFLEENHYELKLVPAMPFSVAAADGQTIEVRGGYYPIKYVHRTKGKDIVEGYTPRKLHAEVSATHRRTEHLRNPDPVELSLQVLSRHIQEVSRYAAMRMACREVLGVVLDSRYEAAFGKTQSFEAYEDLKMLMKHVANPAELENGVAKSFARWSRTALTATALMGNLKTVAMQGASATIGIEELGSFYTESLLAIAQNRLSLLAEIRSKSAMMAHRAEYYDVDLQTEIGRMADSPAERARKRFANAGYFLMRFMDAGVASVGWYGKYLQTVDRLTAEGVDPAQIEARAVAQADDFVARTQGAARTIDMTPVQLDPIGRLLSPFITPAAAQYNTMLEDFGAAKEHRLSPAEAFGAFLFDLLVPALYSGLIAALASGMFGDDDDKDRALKRFVQELVSTPFSGIPVVRDVAVAAGGLLANNALGGKKLYRGDILDAGMVSAANDIFTALISGTDAALNANWARAAWLWSDALGSAAHVPAIRIYTKAKKLYENNGGLLPEFLQAVDDAVKAQVPKRSKP